MAIASTCISFHHVMCKVIIIINNLVTYLIFSAKSELRVLKPCLVNETSPIYVLFDVRGLIRIPKRPIVPPSLPPPPTVGASRFLTASSLALSFPKKDIKRSITLLILHSRVLLTRASRALGPGPRVICLLHSSGASLLSWRRLMR